jgi:hypothetical protein
VSFGRIFGASRQKPGFPLQVLGFAYANPVGFPLQSPCAGGSVRTRIFTAKSKKLNKFLFSRVRSKRPRLRLCNTSFGARINQDCQAAE